VLFRLIQKVASLDGRRSASVGSYLIALVVVCADVSRDEPSPLFALAIAVLTRSCSAVGRIVTITKACDPGARLPRSHVAIELIEH